MGGIRTLTSQTDSGTIESAAEDYTAFGTPIHGSLTSGAPHAATPQYAFTGQTRDPYSGLQYHRARWLNTGIGQWTSADSEFDFPVGLALSWAYVGHGPLSGIDPLGTTSLVELAVTGAISGLLFGAAWGGVVGTYQAFFSPDRPDGFWDKLCLIAGKIIVEALKNALMGAVAGPIVGALLKLAGPILQMLAKFGGQKMIRVLVRVSESKPVTDFLVRWRGTLSSMGGHGFEGFVGRIAELLGAGRVKMGLVRAALGKAAEYDVVFTLRGVVNIIECKWSRQAFGYGARFARDWARKKMVADASGMAGAKYSFYVLTRLTPVQTRNLVSALKAAGISNPEVRSGFVEVLKHLWSIMF